MSTRNFQWHVHSVRGLGQESWVGDASKIRASEVRRQKHDGRNAALILKLMLERRFPRIWMLLSEEKDLRRRSFRRCMLARIRRRVKNESQHMAMNQGATEKNKLCSKKGERMPLVVRPGG